MTMRRKPLILALLLVVLAAVGWLLYRRSQSPPAAARLLPEGEVLVYANLVPVHLADLSKSKPVQIDGDYQNFIEQTGIQIERDLDEVAMSRRDTADGRDTESAEVFIGRFDEQRLKSYLEKISSLRETYRERTIFVIPHEGHNVRVCLLGNARVAVTNMASSDAMHEMIDASLKLQAGKLQAGKLPEGPSLLQLYYHRVPVGSLGWVVARMPSGSRAPQMPNGMSFDFLQNTVTVASLRFTGDLLVRADVLAASEKDAKRVVEAATAFLFIYQSAAQSFNVRGADVDVTAAINSIQVHQEKSVAVFNATLSPRFLKKLVSQAQSEATAPEPSPLPTPTTPFRKRRR
jgi:hypothetical protein